MKPSDKRYMQWFDEKAKVFHKFTPKQLQRRRDIQRNNSRTTMTKRPIKARMEQTGRPEDEFKPEHDSHHRKIDEDALYETWPRFDPNDPIPALIDNLNIEQLLKLYKELGDYLVEEVGF